MSTHYGLELVNGAPLGGGPLAEWNDRSLGRETQHRRDPQAIRLATLLDQCGRKNQEAFRELYDLTAPKLFGVARHLLRQDDVAEEVLQECYVKIWNRAADYAITKGAPLTWMTSIVRNRCFDLLRRSQHEATGAPYDVAVDTYPDQNPGPMEQLVASGESAALSYCLAELEPAQRQSIMLAFYHGLTHSEVANHMKQPLGTVKTWIRSGLKHLRKCPGVR